MTLICLSAADTSLETASTVRISSHFSKNSCYKQRSLISLPAACVQTTQNVTVAQEIVFQASLLCEPDAMSLHPMHPDGTGRYRLRVTVAGELLTLRVEQYLQLQQGAGEQLEDVLHPQQVKHFPDGKVKERQLRRAGPLAHHGPVHARELERPPRGRQGHLVEDVVDEALQRQGRRLGGRHGLVELLQHLPTGLREGHGRYQADALRHVERVAADVVRVEALQARDGGRGVEHVARRGVLVSMVLRCRRGGGSVQDVVLLRVVHVVESLHGAADLLAGHLLEEGEGEAVRPRAVLPGDDEGVELGLAGIDLRPERQTLGHAELCARTGRKRHQGVEENQYRLHHLIV